MGQLLLLGEVILSLTELPSSTVVGAAGRSWDGSPPGPAGPLRQPVGSIRGARNHISNFLKELLLFRVSERQKLLLINLTCE